MSEETIKPCPSCGSRAVFTWDWAYEVYCPDCLMHGPRAASKKDTLAAWNALPRREDFYAELLALAAWANGLCEAANGNDDFEQGMAAAHGETAEYTHDIARKYAPAKPEKGEG